MPDRRDFFRHAAAFAWSRDPRNSAQQCRAAMPAPRAKALMDSLGLKYPILCRALRNPTFAMREAVVGQFDIFAH